MKRDFLFILVTSMLLMISCSQEMDSDIIGKWYVNSIYVSDTSSSNTSLPDCFFISNEKYIGKIEFEKNRNIQLYNKEGRSIGSGFIAHIDSNSLLVTGLNDKETNYTIYRETDTKINLTTGIGGETLNISLTRN